MLLQAGGGPAYPSRRSVCLSRLLPSYIPNLLHVASHPRHRPDSPAQPNRSGGVGVDAADQFLSLPPVAEALSILIKSAGLAPAQPHLSYPPDHSSLESSPVALAVQAFRPSLSLVPSNVFLLPDLRPRNRSVHSPSPGRLEAQRRVSFSLFSVGAEQWRSAVVTLGHSESNRAEPSRAAHADLYMYSPISPALGCRA